MTLLWTLTARRERCAILSRPYRTDRGLAAAAVDLGFENHFLVFSQPRQASALKGGRVHKYVRAPAIWSDETIALLVIVEFHGTGGHQEVPVE
jgi:hypothetical protein